MCREVGKLTTGGGISKGRFSIPVPAFCLPIALLFQDATAPLRLMLVRVALLMVADRPQYYLELLLEVIPGLIGRLSDNYHLCVCR